MTEKIKTLQELGEEYKDIHWDEIIDQHSVNSIKKDLKYIFDFSAVKHGNKNQGDIVIINLKPAYNHQISFEEYFSHCHWVDKIEKIGIYTNIYWNREFFTRTTKYINENNITFS